ncbi:D-alanine--poly(phosphoribitol) ligase [Oxalicibacterium flavum]|uniref:D-alanine--poly(Phosphoribitol) ligase n=1 Tax=Oxalicibacterium flavum TaxID=179467 RepID=A0A8J2UJX6_9BURK|nr:AMP-binding protein [Oxalicibacterium flavum]GGC03314.1 D-alanine--poly(phosphoribitol) ligase [Oxalicibacterium flavum]
MHFDFDRFEFVGEAMVDEQAVVHASGSLDWQQLQQATDDWMRQAEAAGVLAGAPLLITGHKEPAFLIAMLGCLMMKVPFVPVDVINPHERIARISSLLKTSLRYDAQLECFEGVVNQDARLEEEGVAYIMFTSGSTGDPKGVQIGRESVSLFAGWILHSLALGERPVFMDQMLFSFDFSLFNWVGALVTGGACVLCSREIIARRDHFLAYLAHSRATVWASTPSFLRQQLIDPDFCQEKMPDLRVFLFGAESLSVALVDEIWLRFPAARIINSYGPTEATCSTTWVEVDKTLRDTLPNPFPIGRAKPYATVFIDEGEICIAGDHVMRGYLNRSDLNQTRMFVRDGKRGYRTGDIGEMDSHGLVTFRGRMDDQIKFHGYRIELAEIDLALSALPSVRAGVAVALRRPEGTIVRLVGFVELRDTEEGNGTALPECLANWREILAMRLPPYMVPSELLACEQLSITVTDKVDRKQMEQLYKQTYLSQKSRNA